MEVLPFKNHGAKLPVRHIRHVCFEDHSTQYTIYDDGDLWEMHCSILHSH